MKFLVKLNGEQSTHKLSATSYQELLKEILDTFSNVLTSRFILKYEDIDEDDDEQELICMVTQNDFQLAIEDCIEAHRDCINLVLFPKKSI